MVYIQNNAVNQVWLGINEWATLSNPTYLFQLQNSQGRDSVYFIPRNITANYPDSYANKYLVFEFETFLGNPIQLRATGATDCNIHLVNENQYWLYIWEQPQGDGNLNPILSTNKVFNELAFIFVDENNEYYTGNTANFADNVIYYSQGNTPPPSPSPSSTPPSPTSSPTPTPSITPTLTATPTITPSITPSITPTETLTPTPTPSSDLRFQLGSGFNAQVSSIVQDPQGDYIMIGDFNFYKDSQNLRINNILPNGGTLGGLQSGFIDQVPAQVSMRQIILNPDPNRTDAYIAMFNQAGVQYSGQTIGHLLQINYETGELIQNGITNATNASTTSITFSGDSLFIVGNFFQVQSITQNRLFKISQDGVVDTTFRTNMGTGFPTQMNDIAQTIDGRLICVGQSTTFNGNTRNGIFRINTDGTFDSTFNSGTGLSPVSAQRVVVLSDGRILVGGNFTSYNGTSKTRIVLLNSDGTIDTSFDAGSLFSGLVSDLAVDETNGWIYVITSTQGIGGNQNIDYFCRISFTGVLDTSFPASQMGYTAIPDVSFKGRIFLTTSGKILVGGNFTYFGNQRAGNLIQLNQDGTSDTRTDI